MVSAIYLTVVTCLHIKEERALDLWLQCSDLFDLPARQRTENFEPAFPVI